MTKIGIVGAGFVGSAVDNGFKKNVKKFLVDPKLNTNLSDLKIFDPDFIFICVPTPMDINGNQDSSIIESVLSEINKVAIDSILIVKSTVLPNVISRLYGLYPKLVYNPEFLREKTANEDFINQSTLILGGASDLTEEVYKLYKECTLCTIKSVFKTDAISASMAKYAINSFLASKVIFFNQLKDVYDQTGASAAWNDFVNIVSSDKRIGSSHMDVPGHDGRYGFGGACFPKDTAALVSLSNKYHKDFSFLKEVISINNKIRSKYSDLDSREKEQGVNFNIDIS